MRLVQRKKIQIHAHVLLNKQTQSAQRAVPELLPAMKRILVTADTQPMTKDDLQKLQINSFIIMK